MKFPYTDLGPWQPGEVVEVKPTAIANARLADDLNFARDENGAKHIRTRAHRCEGQA